VYWVDFVDDINGDGYQDVIVTSLTNPQQTEGYSTKGLVKLIYGNADVSNLLINDVTLTEQDFFTRNPLIGYRALGIGDFNNDSINDFAISARGFSENSTFKTGAVALFYGKNEKMDYTKADTIIYPIGNGMDTFLFKDYGFSMDANGDFDGDGIHDIVIKGITVNANQPLGEVIFGGRNERALIYYPEAMMITEFNMGLVKFVPDLNGDQRDELLITSGFNINGNAGLIWGTNEALDVEPSIIFKSLNDYEELGGAYHAAVGNYDNNEETTEFVLVQSLGNIEAFNSGLWSVYQVNTNLTSIQEAETSVNRFALKQNYPNPFNPVTTISFSLPVSTQISLKVYNAIGQLIETLISRSFYTSGEYSITFDATNLASGTYFYELKTESGRMVKTMTVIK
jgi:hypothetical protein